MLTTPKEVSDVLGKLSPSDRQVMEAYLETLQSKVLDLGGTLNNDSTTRAAPTDADDSRMADNGDDSDFPPLYTGPEDDMEKAGDYKMQAADLKAEGKLEEALEKYNLAVLAAPPSALLYANRAMALNQLGKHKAAERDCNEALKLNPDSAKALKVRGKARKELSNWEGALSDLSQAQTIDFDPDIVEDLKFLTEKHVEQEKKEAADRIEKETKMRQRAEEVKKAKQEQANAARPASGARSASAAGGCPMGGGAGGMPAGGGMPGMPAGMGGIMEMLMSDPELQEAMKNPKVIAAFSSLMSAPGGPMGLMSNPGKLQELMADPEVGPVLEKIMSKFGGGMPGGMGGFGGGMPGGMGGGGAPGGAGDDIPDMDDMPDLD